MSTTAWLVTIGFILVLFTVDLGQALLKPHEVGFREAALASVFYIAIAIAFGVAFGFVAGWEWGTEYFAGYILEKSLSVDNLFVFVVIMGAFAVPKPYQQRVLIIGIFLALILRVVFILLGAALLERFSFMFLLFGLLLIFTAIQLFRHRDQDDHPGAASMDGAWDRIANAFMKPQIGSQLDELNSLFTRFDQPPDQQPPGGQQAGWFQYFERDIKKLLGKDQVKPFKKSYCGKGDLEKCQTAVWNAIAEAGQELTTEYGTGDPSQWHSDATAEEIEFDFYNLMTLAYTNRPSGIQQVIAFNGHR